MAERTTFHHYKAAFLIVAVSVLWMTCVCLAQESIPEQLRLKQSVKDILSGPDNRPRADTYYLIAMSQARKGETEQAMGTIEHGLRIEARHLGLLNLRGALLARTGRIREAIAAFNKILQIAPDDTYAKESLRALLPPVKKTPVERPMGPPKIGVSPDAPASPLGNKEGIIAEKGVKSSAAASGTAEASPRKILEASYFDGIKLKQQCFQAQSAIKSAQEAFVKTKPDAKGKLDLKALIDAKMLTAAPTCPDGGQYSWEGTFPVCSKHGAYPQIEAEVNTVFADFNRGMTAKFRRNFPDALNAFGQVVVMYPRWAEAHFQLGDTLFRLGDDRKAIDEIRACLKLDENHLDAKLLLANLLFKIGHKEASLELLDGISKSHSGSVYGLSSRSIASAIRSGRNYYQIFPPN
ncbi:MAG: tetratricopeptide repeat protein [Candidatus Riflebacteria bacterium]|nr:tetratricopeptide repeat protein [Candidatus Riflebacteria bacterium]